MTTTKKQSKKTVAKISLSHSGGKKTRQAFNLGACFLSNWNACVRMLVY
jgi:hypothetical protein